jgi:hypothetical protein
MYETIQYDPNYHQILPWSEIERVIAWNARRSLLSLEKRRKSPLDATKPER